MTTTIIQIIPNDHKIFDVEDSTSIQAILKPKESWECAFINLFFSYIESIDQGDFLEEDVLMICDDPKELLSQYVLPYFTSQDPGLIHNESIIQVLEISSDEIRELNSIRIDPLKIKDDSFIKRTFNLDIIKEALQDWQRRCGIGNKIITN